jgi:hypothetical protein
METYLKALKIGSIQFSGNTKLPACVLLSPFSLFSLMAFIILSLCCDCTLHVDIYYYSTLQCSTVV